MPSSSALLMLQCWSYHRNSPSASVDWVEFITTSTLLSAWLRYWWWQHHHRQCGHQKT
jgi:hypothetical protein